ncbi:tail assembly protein [Oxalobacter paraformigenes]|uniref:Tail assembly protein n=1 Tax=Oxalobacter paraformigenes TaxID=556268 RepID=C3X3C9_9BURK|nr:tail assembly protein [Oxalobacter paraformigenes]EEO27715.2 hypothetical protein OFAG_00868 [Oxalobacter paraformigenes]
MTSLKTIRLYGKLGARFGRIHRLAVASAAEAVRALCALKPGFERELMTSRDRGIGYAVFLGKKNLKAEQLAETADDRDIRIAPMLRGAGLGGIFQVIAGVALIAVACIITGGMPLASMMAFNLGIMPGILSNIGFMLMMSGITQMLSPQPKGLSARNSPANEPSYTFNGVVNTTAQGGPVPLGYGRMIVGSAVISAGIYSADRL